MRKFVVLAVSLLGYICICMANTYRINAQNSPWIDQNASGRNVFGPFHRPVIVKNEYGTSDQALLVYKDRMVEMYVPDVTDEHGYMRLQELNHYGTFMTMLYMYDLKTEQTRSYLVAVNTQKKTISLRTDVFADAATFTFQDAPYAIEQAILNTAKIMQREIALQHIH